MNMSQIFDQEGNVVPITLIKAGPCFLTQKKTKEKDGYQALQIGWEKLKKEKKSRKKKNYRYLREFKGGESELKEGDKIEVSSFEKGDKVKIRGISKGKGFQGAVKRWGFHGLSATHGVKREHRSLGSVGATGPQRVLRGKKMPGQMGAEKKVVENLEVIEVDSEKGIIAVKGAVPGHRGTLLEILC